MNRLLLQSILHKLGIEEDTVIYICLLDNDHYVYFEKDYRPFEQRVGAPQPAMMSVHSVVKEFQRDAEYDRVVYTNIDLLEEYL